MKLTLTNPIAFIDIESTGVDRENDRIIELAVVKVFPDGTRETKCRRFNPGIPIPAGATAVHGITDADVAGLPAFSEFAQKFLDYIKGCDLGGFNSNNFDIPLLFNECSRAGIYFDYKAINMIDIGNIFKINEPRTLGAAVKLYLNKEHGEAHSAEADAIATADVFFQQMEKYELPTTMPELALYSNYGNKLLDLSGKFVANENGDVLLNFGKYRGEKAVDHIDFLEWMVNRASFNRDTVDVANEIINAQYAS